MGKKKRGEVVARLLDLTGLREQRDKFPSQISGGQQQRVAIARALAYEPDLLLFDESFSALDPQTRNGLRREIRALLRKLGIPALFITHDQEEAMEMGDQIAILNRGRLGSSARPTRSTTTRRPNSSRPSSAPPTWSKAPGATGSFALDWALL